MKVLFLITRGDEIGGAQTHVRDVILGLRDKYGTECILATGSVGKFTEEMQAKGIQIAHIKSMKRDICIHDLKAFIELRGLLKRIKPDIISCHSSKAGVLGRLASLGLDIKKVFTAHGWAFTEGISKRKANFYKMIELALSYITDAIINVSEYDRNLAIKNKIKSKHYIIRNCITDHHPITKLEHDDIKYPLRFVMVARFCEQKDHETLIKAFAKVDPKYWQVTLLGGGDSRSAKSLVNNLALNSKFDFVGEVSNVPKYLSNSDVFILISNWEGFPISIIEAMRYGLPIIASNVGGVSEAVENNKNGFLIPRSDIATLEDRLRNIIAAPESLLVLGKASRSIYDQRFTLNHMIDAYYEVYSGVVK